MFRRNRKPYEPPKKRKPLERVGKAGTIRLYGEAKSKLREEVWHRSGGFCELKLQGCNGYTPWKDGHLHHVRSLGASGSDSAENCKWTCPNCHFLTHQYGPSGEKPCKSKSEAGRG